MFTIIIFIIIIIITIRAHLCRHICSRLSRLHRSTVCAGPASLASNWAAVQGLCEITAAHITGLARSKKRPDMSCRRCPAQ